MAYAAPQPQEPQKTSGLAITALILSCLLCLPIFQILGLILGIVALVKIGKNRALKGKGLAVAAIIVGGVGLPVSAGMSAAVAIPAFIKYIRQAKTAEADAKLAELNQAILRYHAEHGRLPDSAPLSPATSCCLQGADGRCPGGEADAAWSHPAWQAVGFRIDEPHYFQFEIEASTTAFTARAMADLDCDGVHSTFERAGAVTPTGELQLSRATFRNLETE